MNKQDRKEDRKKLLDHIRGMQHKIVGAAEIIVDTLADDLKTSEARRKAQATVARRQIANMLQTSQFCANYACRRARCCRGEPSHCLQSVVPLLPEQAFDGLLHRKRPRRTRPAKRGSVRA